MTTLRALAAAALRLAAAAALCAMPAGAHATADGPDHFRVAGAGGAPLALRAAPHDGAAAIAEVPAGADGLVNFGCTGGMTFDEWRAATEPERAAAAGSRWCRVGHGATIAWARGDRLAEGSDTASFRGGDRLSDLAGTAWRVRDFVGAPAEGEAWIRFGADGSLTGDTGCNRLRGGYEAGPDGLSLAPLATTRMACPGPAMRLESSLLAALGAASGMAAGERLLALFAENGDLLVTLVPRDAT